MKRFIMLFIVVALMLTACTNGSKEAKTAAEVNKTGRSIQAEDNLNLTELDDESQTALKKQCFNFDKCFDSLCIWSFV